MNPAEVFAKREEIIRRYNRKEVHELYNADKYAKTAGLESDFMKVALSPEYAGQLISSYLGKVQGAEVARNFDEELRLKLRLHDATLYRSDLYQNLLARMRDERLSIAERSKWRTIKDVLFSAPYAAPAPAPLGLHSYEELHQHLRSLKPLRDSLKDLPPVPELPFLPGPPPPSGPTSVFKALPMAEKTVPAYRKVVSGVRPYVLGAAGLAALGGLGYYGARKAGWLGNDDAKTAAYNAELIKQAWIGKALLEAGKAAIKPFMGTALKTTAKSVGKWGLAGAGLGATKGIFDVATQPTSLNPDEHLGFGHVFGSAVKGGLMGAGGRAAFMAGKPAYGAFRGAMPGAKLLSPVSKGYGRYSIASANDAYLRNLFAKFAAGSPGSAQMQAFPSQSVPAAFFGPGTEGASAQTAPSDIPPQPGITSNPTPPAAVDTAGSRSGSMTQGQTIINPISKNPPKIEKADTFFGDSDTKNSTKDIGKDYGEKFNSLTWFAKIAADTFPQVDAVTGASPATKPATTTEEKPVKQVWRFWKMGPSPKQSDPNSKDASFDWLGKVAAGTYSQPVGAKLPQTPKKLRKPPTSDAKGNNRFVNIYETKPAPAQRIKSTPAQPFTYPGQKKPKVERYGEPMPKYSKIDDDFVKVALVSSAIKHIKDLQTGMKLAKTQAEQQAFQTAIRNQVRQLQLAAEKAHKAGNPNLFLDDVLPTLAAVA